MKIQSTSVKDEMRRRLRRIEGQARGIQRMFDDERDCREIVQQLKAMRAALKNASAVLMRSYAEECLLQTDGHPDRGRLVDEIMDLVS